MSNGKISVYNTLSKKTEELVPIARGRLNMFVCGQTVYDDAHLGHAKSYINYDIMARWLRHSGLNVTYIQNITDIEDKIIARAREKGMTPEKLAEFYEKRLKEDMERLGVTKNIDKYPRSHDYMNEIKSQIQLLLDKGYAYALDGDIYYDVSKFPGYTELSGMKLEELERHRIEPKPGKRHEYDFALWKAAKPGEPSWEISMKVDGAEQAFSGRPGWHIEDTAITHALFGPQYDIHGGARELIFPHHSNAIAQSEAAFGVKPSVKYWLHSGTLNVGSEKMSKSLKNFVTIRETLEKHDPEAIRLMIAMAHYTKEISYKESMMEEAGRRLYYLRSSFSLFYNSKDSESGSASSEILEVTAFLEKEFAEAMDDNFNTPLAISKMQSAIEDLRKITETTDSVNSRPKGEAIKKVLELAAIIGILEDGKYRKALGKEEATLIKKRDELRKEKNYPEADRIRDELLQKYGLRVDDSEYGPLWYYA